MPDLGAFGPLVGSLLNAGSPAIAGVITLALTPEIGPLAGLVGGGVGKILPMIATALGAPEDATADQLAAKVDADPDSAKTALASLEAEHTFILAKQKVDNDYALSSQAQQVSVNTVEAQNPSLFVSGWRPLIGWSLGGLVMTSFTLPFFVWFLLIFGVHLPTPLPVLDAQAVMILTGLLGLTVVTSTIEKPTTATKLTATARKTR